MTRKDYTLLASALARSRPLIPPPKCSPPALAAYLTWHETRDQIIKALQADNPRFNRERFIAATETDPS